jgi:predicted AlkP superfamily phosphohydrolase/phosphomutase
MRVLCLGLDGADHDLVEELRAQGKLPTIDRLARAGTFGPLRSTIPAATPTAWSSFLTGLNPGGHGIFNFSTNPNRSLERVESAASRAGTPFWRALGAAGRRSAFVTVPFTYPPEPIDGVLVTGYGGPLEPAILPDAARARILERHPGLVTAHHPMKERWWEDFDGFTRKLLEHVEQVADVCKLAMELEPDLALLCVDFMSADFAGHLGWHRLDPHHPAHRPDEAGDELVRVYQAVDAACGELAGEAARIYGEEPTVLVLSDHGMKPIYWTFHLNRWLEQAGYLRYRRRSLQRLRRTRLDLVAKVDQRLVRTRRPYGRALDRLPLPSVPEDRLFADVDYGSTRAYAFGYGGQLFLGEASGALGDAGFERELVAALEAVRHPETDEPAFEVHRKADLYHGPFAHKAPDLVVLPRDERVHVDASRWHWTQPFDRHEHLDPAHAYGYSGHHGLNGILAAAGPGIAAGALPADAEITQLPATLLALFGIDSDLDGAPLEPILERAGAAREAVTVAATATSEESVYAEDEEAAMLERLRDLGYE